MRLIIVLIELMMVMSTISPAAASTSCTTRQSGSVSITSCSSSNHSAYRECRSYRSGSVIKTTCR
jgi:hypothetical protein